eukprot:263147-Chlamydomonas_euryale.AAC.1
MTGRDQHARLLRLRPWDEVGGCDLHKASLHVALQVWEVWMCEDRQVLACHVATFTPTGLRSRTRPPQPASTSACTCGKCGRCERCGRCVCWCVCVCVYRRRAEQVHLCGKKPQPLCRPGAVAGVAGVARVADAVSCNIPPKPSHAAGLRAVCVRARVNGVGTGCTTGGAWPGRRLARLPGSSAAALHSFINGLRPHFDSISNHAVPLAWKTKPRASTVSASYSSSFVRLLCTCGVGIR